MLIQRTRLNWKELMKSISGALVALSNNVTCKIFVIAMTLMLIVAGTSDCVAGSLLTDGHRPGNFFTSMEDHAKSICRPLLRSLNRPFSVKQSEINLVDNPDLIQNLLLSINLQVTWQRKKVQDGVVTSLLDLATIDIFNNKHITNVFRLTMYSMNRNFNLLIVSDSFPPELSSSAPLPHSVVTGLQGLTLAINPRTAPQVWANDKVKTDDTFIINIVQVRGKALILAIPALAAGLAFSDGKSVDLYVLELQPEGGLSLVCQFRSISTAGVKQ